MSSQHKHDPISIRPPDDTYGWLDDIAEREGRPVRRIIGDALERARRIDEAGLASFDREQDRRFIAWHAARGRGEDGAEELAALNAAIEAYRTAIGQWHPDDTK